MNRIKGAIIGVALALGTVACATAPEVPEGPTAEEIAEAERLARLAEEQARLEAERRAAEAAERERLAAEEARRRAEQEARDRDIALNGAPGSLKEFQKRAGERVYFDVDQWRLDEEDKAVLARQADWLQTNSNVTIQIAGNCDERGTREYNIALGERRANVVRDYLVSLGISGDRISVSSNGKDKPWVDGTGPDIWAKNRNGHTLLVSGFNGQT